MAEFSYDLTYAGVPFCLDVAKVVRMGFSHPEFTDPEALPPRKHQPMADLIEELDRLVPFIYLNDFDLPSVYPGRNLGAMALRDVIGPMPGPQIKIGDWYYPTTMSRWSVFRGLATSSQAKAMLAATNGVADAEFKMKCVPQGFALSPASRYEITSPMRMLPPRPLAEHGTQFDGLFLITLVDERYYLQGIPHTFHVAHASSWSDMIVSLGQTMGIDIVFSLIPPGFSGPEPDSQFWCNYENAPTLLDALAANIGCVAVRKLDGTYALLDPSESKVLVDDNRGNAQTVVRACGGDIFSEIATTKSGDLSESRNSVLPENVRVTFPKYVDGDDPVPHFYNSRFNLDKRPSSWYEESYGDVFYVDTPIAQGGGLVEGLTGYGTAILHDTAKAIYATEAAGAGNAIPDNVTDLQTLATLLATAYYGQQAGAALDETYPGTIAWDMEGFHDVVWSWSAKRRMGSTRVLRTQWNINITEFQHVAPDFGASAGVPRGVGGPTVAQTWRDSDSLVTQTSLSASITAGETAVTLASVAHLPTQNRWRGRIESETILFEGTGGNTAVTIARRGIDGSLAVAHPAGAAVTHVVPDAAYGVNLVTFEKGQFVYPKEWTNGIGGVNVVPQTQTVLVTSNSAQVIDGRDHYPAAVLTYNAGAFPQLENVWLVERNGATLAVDKRYDGQFAGHSGDPVRPIYLTNATTAGANIIGDCGITAVEDAEGVVTLSVDNADLAGPGLGPWSHEPPFPGCGLQVLVACGLRIGNPNFPPSAGEPVTVHTGELSGLGLTPGVECSIDVLLDCGLKYYFAPGSETVAGIGVDATVLAGQGLQADPSGEFCVLDVGEGCGITVDANFVHVDATQIAGPGLYVVGLCGLAVGAGCGIIVDDNFVHINSAALAGPGLGAFGLCGLQVNTGCGIEIVEDAVSVNVAQLVQNPGLKVGADGCSIALDIDCGLKFSGNQLEVNPVDLAGRGLVPNPSGTCALDVGEGCGITVDENSVAVNAAAIAGQGLGVEDICKLKINTGCGTLIENDALIINNEDLAGLGIAQDEECALKIDPEPVRFSYFRVLESLQTSISGCAITISTFGYSLEVGFNDGDAVVHVEAVDPFQENEVVTIGCDCICSCIDQCASLACCGGHDMVGDTLYITFSGTFDPVTDPITLTWDADLESWVGYTLDCSIDGIILHCEIVDGEGNWTITTTVGNGSGTEVTCDPLLIQGNGSAFGPCSGNWTFEVTDTPP